MRISFTASRIALPKFDGGSVPVSSPPLIKAPDSAAQTNRESRPRASGVLLTAPEVSPTKDELIAKEIQETRDALQAFQTAIEAHESQSNRE